MFCSFEALPPLGVKLRRYMGAFWTQCIERVCEEALEDDKPDAILTLDYDSIFSKRDASMLMQLMCCYPEADAIAALQSGRGKELPLFTIRGDDGKNAWRGYGGHVRAGSCESLDGSFRPNADPSR
jgi:hypothetical protein